jgi:hypothetical protein
MESQSLEKIQLDFSLFIVHRNLEHFSLFYYRQFTACGKGKVDGEYKGRSAA